MSRTNLFFKVEVEHARDEAPERLGEEICRMLRKLYGVRDLRDPAAPAVLSRCARRHLPDLLRHRA